MKNEATLMFFDFYTLSLLNYFAGDNSTNHANKVRRIKESYEKKVDELYNDIRHGLTYSVIREFRHYEDYGPCNNTHIKLAKAIIVEHEDGLLKKFLEKEYFKLDISKNRISNIVDGFMEDSWDDNYGGKLWGIAAGFLLDNPESIKSKELWVDRVLDLHHNGGHILNKTKFSALSEEVEFSTEKGKKRKVFNTYNALDYRRYARTLSELNEFSSPRVNRLVSANLNFIPEMIR